MSSKMADLRHPGEAHESERGQARQVREDFRFLQAAATGYRADVVIEPALPRYTARAGSH